MGQSPPFWFVVPLYGTLKKFANATPRGGNIIKTLCAYNNLCAFKYFGGVNLIVTETTKLNSLNG